ncbi:hypothetical protein Mext_3538 [Methylorubrum extorquens PA1]|nr:hypothetical protein Mext_3538 [Methylorubrum extorquens PA1]
MGKTKKPIDWTAIERDYTKTSLPVRELARWYNCDEKAIRLRAKAGSWLRPGQESSAAPPQAPQPLDALVAPIVERLREMAPDEPAQTPDIVERARRVALRMVDELEIITNRRGDLDALIDKALAGEENSKQRASLQKALKAVPFGIEYPRIGKLGVEAPIWIDNVNREVARYLEPATKLNESVVVIFRGYLASDPDTVGHGPFRLLLRSVKRKGARLDGTLTMADPTKLRVMREIYDSQRFPALMVAAGA